MKTKVQKWGKSLAVRLPSSFIKELKVDKGYSIDLVLDNGVIVFKTVVEYSLDELLKGVNENNIHSESQTGG